MSDRPTSNVRMECVIVIGQLVNFLIILVPSSLTPSALQSFMITSVSERKRRTKNKRVKLTRMEVKRQEDLLKKMLTRSS